MSNLVKIGKLSFSRDSVEKGHYGKVYRGLFDEFVNVSIERIDKSEIFVDKKLLRTTDLHPNIVRFYGSEEDADGEFQFIATETVCGTLKDFVGGNYKGPPILCDNPTILKQITCALEYLHEKQIFHRDLKPSNVVISCPDGTLQPRMKLANFGYSRVSKTALPLWKLVGTKGWMAPEVYYLDSFTFSMDIFSLGLIFSYVLSGGFHAFGSSKEERVIRIKMKQPMILQIEHLMGVVGVAGVYELICAMLSFNPEERPRASTVLNYTFLHRQSFITGETRVHLPAPPEPLPTPTKTKVKSEPLSEEEADNTSNSPQTTSPSVNEDSIPPLMPIRMSNGEPFQKRMREEEEFHQQLPTPPLSFPPSPPLHETAVTQDQQRSERSPSSISAASTCPLNVPCSPTSTSPPFKTRSLTPSSTDYPQPSSSADMSDQSSSHQHQVKSETEPKENKRFKTSADEQQESQRSREPISSPVSPPSSTGSGQESAISRSSSRNEPYRSDDRSQCSIKYERELVSLCLPASLGKEDLARILQLIGDRSLNINYTPPPDYKPPLLLLCQNHKSNDLLAILKALLQRDDLDLHVKSHKAYNALMFLTRFYPNDNLIDCVRLLISRGVTLESQGTGPNSLHLLCYNYSGDNILDIALPLLYHSTNLEYDGRCTKILWNRGYKEESKYFHKILKQLRDRRNPKEVELLELCSRPHLNKDSVDRFRQLTSDQDLNHDCTDDHGNTPLLLLCRNNQDDSLYKHVQCLLESKRVYPNLTGMDGVNSLSAVCLNYGGKCLLEVVKLLVRRGINVNNTSLYGFNALFSLFSNAKEKIDSRLFEVVKVLVDSGLNANAKTNDGLNVLITLTENHNQHPDYAKIVRFLVKSGLDVNVKSTKGRPLFHSLCKVLSHARLSDSHFNSILQLLIDCGVAVLTRDSDGYDALDVLRRCSYPEHSSVIQFLMRQ